MTPGVTVLSCRDLAVRRQSADSTFSLSVPRLDLRTGDRLALMGQSGSGKSTLINILALAMRPDPQGSLLIRAEGGRKVVDANALWRKGRDDALTRLRRSAFGYVQQVGCLLPFLTVEQNLTFTQTLNGRRSVQDARALAERLGVAGVLKRRPDALSVGQRQRVSIARALAHRPFIVLADEPTASLDRDNAAEVMRLLVEQAQERGVALVVASHDLALCESFGFEIVPAQVLPGAQTVFHREPAGRRPVGGGPSARAEAPRVQ
ncbi:ABC transporter ATP-binding protein [Caenispirillum salinarum]|uniref:ABC transporter ATP-binding protein n=1 Tax=Caenispirillum salinarum TaxID=859058 RepID=UPI000A0746E3|nr:ATP-binding cassette domain-containing protein [Caenispirillum salinarum]